MPGARMLWIVAMKLMPPRIDASPIKCSAMIQASMPPSLEYWIDDSGG